MRIAPLVFFLAALIHAAPAPIAPLPLAAEGKALLPIVLAPQASEATKAAAAELAGYLERITSAKFEVQTGAGAQGILVGTAADFPDAVPGDMLAVRKTYDGKEAFAIRTEKERLLLIGATEMGTSHAVFAFLEHLGCRWFFPAPEWEVIPRQKTLAVSLDLTDRPHFLARRIWYGYGAFGDDKQHSQGRSCTKDYEAWARHNRMASSFRVSAGHAWQGIILGNKKIFEEHPEYRALVKDQRKGEQLCVSNPAVRKLALDYALGYLAKNPDREMVSMECSDGDGHCECEDCKKLGSISDRVFGLANEVAREVQSKYPGKMVGCLAYGSHSEPPRMPLEPNVYVQLTAGFIRGQYSFEELAELWPQKCPNMGFYEYFSVWLWDFDKLPGGKGANVTVIRDSIRRYAKLGATSIDAESGNNWGPHGLGYYVANKLMWHPETDVDAVRTDFFEKAFGPAAVPMRRYYEQWRPDLQPLVSRGLIGELFEDLKEASRLAKEQPGALARIDDLKHYLHYVHLRWMFDHEKDKTRQKQLALDILTFTYRTRYEYMNHWNAIQTTFAGDVDKKLQAPEWVRNNKAPKPWAEAPAVTPAETEQWFQEGLAYFRPTPVTEVKYAFDDLTPAPGNKASPGTMNQIFQRFERYALASQSGEALEVEVTPGTIAWYRDRADARWTLENAKGVKLLQGTLKLDGEPHLVKMNVPQAGVYYFECNDSSAGWRIKADPSRAVTWLPQHGRKVIHMGYMPELFFYVPKGTKQLQYFYSGGPHKVLGPNHKAAAEVKVEDEVVTVTVPEGSDGQCWSLSPHSHSQLWLFNAPNCFAASPQGLLIPKTALNIR